MIIQRIRALTPTLATHKIYRYVLYYYENQTLHEVVHANTRNTYVRVLLRSVFTGQECVKTLIMTLLQEDDVRARIKER